MRVLTVYHKFKRGGSYHRFRMMLEAYSEAGDEVHYIAVERYPFELPRIHPEILCSPFQRHDSSLFKLYFLLLAPLYTAFVCAKHRVDFLLAFGTANAFIETLAKLLFRRQMVLLVRGDSEYGLRVANASRATILMHRMLDRIGLWSSDRVIVNNQDLKEKVKARAGKHGKEVQVLYNNVVIPQLETVLGESQARRIDLGIFEDDFLIVTLGVINQGKNIGLLLKAIRSLGLQRLKLVIIGDVLSAGDDSKLRLKSMAQEMGIDGQVIFAGWKESIEVRRIVQMADLFVIPSFYEGSPNALLEALALNKPCLGSRVPGISDVLYFDELMFDPHDEEELRGRIQRAVLDCRYLSHIRDLCRKRREAFTFHWKKAFLEVTRVSSFRHGGL